MSTYKYKKETNILSQDDVRDFFHYFLFILSVQTDGNFKLPECMMFLNCLELFLVFKKFTQKEKNVLKKVVCNAVQFFFYI